MVNKEKLQWLIQMYEHVLNGGKLLHRLTPNRSWYTTDLVPSIDSDKGEWEIIENGSCD